MKKVEWVTCKEYMPIQVKVCNTNFSYMVAVILYSIAIDENLFTTYVSQKGWNRNALLFSVFIQISNKIWFDGDYTIMPHFSQLEPN